MTLILSQGHNDGIQLTLKAFWQSQGTAIAELWNWKFRYASYNVSIETFSDTAKAFMLIISWMLFEQDL